MANEASVCHSDLTFRLVIQICHSDLSFRLVIQHCHSGFRFRFVMEEVSSKQMSFMPYILRGGGFLSLTGRGHAKSGFLPQPRHFFVEHIVFPNKGSLFFQLSQLLKCFSKLIVQVRHAKAGTFKRHKHRCRKT